LEEERTQTAISNSELCPLKRVTTENSSRCPAVNKKSDWTLPPQTQVPEGGRTGGKKAGEKNPGSQRLCRDQAAARRRKELG